jgi:GGDEF domain-containing protein
MSISRNPESAPNDSLNHMLTDMGMGVAYFDHKGVLLNCNEVFRTLLELAPGSYRGIYLEARQCGYAVTRVAFEPSIGWLHWSAVPSKEDISVRFSIATKKQVFEEREVNSAALDPHSGLPNRRSLISELITALASGKTVHVMLLEPRSPPSVLGLDHPKTDALMIQIGANLERSLSEDERLFRISPLTLAITRQNPSGESEGRMVKLLRLIEDESINYCRGGHPLGFVAGLAISRDAATAYDLTEQASRALLHARSQGQIFALSPCRVHGQNDKSFAIQQKTGDL